MTDTGDSLFSLDVLDGIASQPGEEREFDDIQSFVEGRFRGQKVAWQPSARAMIESGAEEVGAFRSEKLADRLKRVQQRRAAEKFTKLMVQKAAFYLRKVPDLGSQERLSSFYTDLVKGGAETKEQIAKMASDAFADSTLQYAGLSFVRDVLTQQPGFDRLKQSIGDALNDLMESRGPEIRAGMNITANAAQFASRGFGKINELRLFYQKIILAHTTIGKTYDAIMNHMDEIDFGVMFHFLKTSVVADLKSAAPSVSRPKLKQCVDDIERLSLIQGMHRQVADILIGLREKHNVGKGFTVSGLFKYVLKLFVQPYAVEHTLGEIISELIIKDLAPLIYLLNNLMRLLRLAPGKAFSKKRDRYSLMGVVQRELDQAAKREK